MKILLFGGAFDPPHIGHINVLNQAISAVQPELVIVVPAGTPPHKMHCTAPAKTRIAMCSCFAPLFKNIEISDIEIKEKGKGYTVNTLNAILKRAPKAEIYLCIGSDSLIEFTSWFRYKEILKKAILVAHGRKNSDDALIFKAAQNLRAEGGRVIITSGVVEEVSSSEIRAAIARGDKTAYNKIPPPADLIAKEQDLYREKTGGLFLGTSEG